MRTYYIKAIITASIGGILYGYDMGVITGALPSLSKYFQLTPDQEEWIVSLLYFGGGLGAAMGGSLCDRFGRKVAILITDFMFGLGALLLYKAQSTGCVMVGRVIMGWAVAVSGIADVAYLYEISSVWDENHSHSHDDSITSSDDETDIDGIANETIASKRVSGGERGSVVSVNEACIALGFLLSYGLAFIIGDVSRDQYQRHERLMQSQDQIDQESALLNVGYANNDSWRTLFAFGGVLAAFQFFGMLCMPESPVWLRDKGRHVEAETIIIKIQRSSNNSVGRLREERERSSSIRGIEMHAATIEPSPPILLQPLPSHDAQRCLKIRRCFPNQWVQLQSLPSLLHLHCQQMMQDILVPYWRQAIIAFVLAASQQFCGHAAILSFSAEIFDVLADKTEGSSQYTNPESDSTSMELATWIGVSKFVTTCIVIYCVEKVGRRALLLLGILCIALSLLFLCVAFAGKYDLSSSSSFEYKLGIIGIYGVAIGYAASYGPLTWLITSEIFPSSIRGRALGFSTIISYLAAGLVSRTFLSLQENLGVSACFMLYLVSTLISFLFVLLGIPETKQMGVEDISKELDKSRLWGSGNYCIVLRPNNSFEGFKSYGSQGSVCYDTGVFDSPQHEIDSIHITSSSKSSAAAVRNSTLFVTTVTPNISLSPRSDSNIFVTDNEII